MSYGVFITRKDHWRDADGPVITKEEWLALVQDDPELTLDETSGDMCYADWGGKCERFDDPWLGLSDGCIYTEGFDQALVDKMVQIANRLGAKVQGMEGETYPLAEAALNEPPAAGRSWLGKLFGR